MLPGMVRARIPALATALALAVPGPALAQSAGDDQYQDPFAGEDQAQSQGGSSEQPSATEPAAPAAPAATAQPAPGGSGSDPAAPAAERRLPYTGADAGAVLLAGTILLAGGVALRVRLRERS